MHFRLLVGNLASTFPTFTITIDPNRARNI